MTWRNSEEDHVHDAGCYGTLERSDQVLCGLREGIPERVQWDADRQLVSDHDDVDLYLDMERGK